MSTTVRYCNYSIGPDAYTLLPDICRSLGDRLVLIGGKTAMEKAKPALDQALAASSLKLLDAIVYGTECTAGTIATLAGRCAQLGAQIVLGMGGGKALDTAKGVADALDLPYITLPTIAATCAATSQLSVLYHDDGRHDRAVYYKTPPLHCLIHTEIIAQAPAYTLRGGIGDTLAKFYEVHFSSRGLPLPYQSSLARQISVQCHDPIMMHGLQALADCEEGIDSIPLREVTLAVIVTTGLVSLLVDDAYNGAIAHSMCYGLSTLPQVAKNHLHGDIVAYGILVQMAVDQAEEQLMGLALFLQRAGFPTHLEEFGLSLSSPELPDVLRTAAGTSDMVQLPYQVDANMLYDALRALDMLP